ncbi:right-handed parallel beta-helix repeat-containing protein [Micromonospora sp. WMMD998]|uniref:PKD domain-containing protein n=1 Tax=Micromonospora sp. WMMD998 TaxID=3016092 RepID=UPI00249CD651|nr:right-handed parallel beta-helix repeat-containing protein [Micromonospora sp. WMMD998]WFE37769.1 PKD domain-containing protein [Micromonospora sp. WMMD998]
MRRTLLAGLTATALTSGSLLTLGGAALAAGDALYVRPSAPTCSDTGPGSYDQPFCSINAAASVVSPGQTVEISGGVYREHVTITRSGTPDAPIVFRTSTSAQLIGPAAGITIDGQHDVTIQRIQVPGAAENPALDVRDASRIAVEDGGFTVTGSPAGPTVRFSGVTDSTISRSFVSGGLPSVGVLLDGTTSGVRLSAVNVSGTANDTLEQSVGIRVEGADNVIVNSSVGRFTGAAVSIAAGARGTTVANNQIGEGTGYGIHNAGATGTAITNNAIEDRCLDGIRVDGGSTGVSVQNNVLGKSRSGGGCSQMSLNAAQIAVAADATADTVVDYNLVDLYTPGFPTIYDWNGTRTGLAAFRAASGQGAHDLDTPGPSGGHDSANSAAPGYPATDRNGTARVDDPAVPNTGAGPTPWADRGPIETVRAPDARFTLTPDLDTGSVTVDASTTVPGVVPVATYRFDFGDGTVVTQDTPAATHRYASRNTYAVSVRVTGTDGRTDVRTQQVSVLPRTGTVGLLALSSLSYVSPGNSPPSWPTLAANRPDLGPTAQFDLADAGNGTVALFVRAAGRYLTADTAGVAALTYQTVLVGNTERFTLVRNADGSVSLRSVASGRYVTATANPTVLLVADAKSIGADQKFYRVDVANAGRTLKAGANSRFVTADSATVKPLIASATSVGAAQRFDVLDLGGGKVALLAWANRLIVTADSAGDKPLIANRTSAGAWEGFTLTRNADGTTSLKATVNSRFVSADSGGNKPLIANRTTIGAWEKFTLGG